MPEPQDGTLVGPRTVTIELVCLWPGHSWRRTLELPAGSTVAAALAASGWEQVPGRPQVAALGIHGQVVGDDRVLRTGDRVELYRALQADPKDVRRARASARTGRRP